MRTILSVVVAISSFLAIPFAEAKGGKTPQPAPPPIAKYNHEGKMLPVFDLSKAGATIGSAPIYPLALRRNGISGSATVLVVIGVDGKVLEAGPSACTHKEFADATVQAVKRWKYRPIVDDSGTPIMYVVRQTVIFALSRDPNSISAPEGSMLVLAERLR